MHCGSSSESDGSSDPPVSNGAIGGPVGYWFYDEAAGFLTVSLPPIQPPSPTFDLSITDVTHTRPPLLEPPSPILYAFDEVQDHVATSACYVNTDSDMLPFTPHSDSGGGNTQATAEASGSFQGTRPLAHDSPVSVPSQDNVYEELRQSIYDRGLTSEAFRPVPEMLFQGFGLGDALRNDFRRLADHDRGAWPANSTFEVPQKLAIVFCFPGYKKHSRQVNVLRHVRGGTLPQTRSKLAHIIAEEMHTFLTLSRQSGKPLVHGDRELDVDDLVLLDIQHISKGSLQPTIGVIVRPPHSAIPT